MYNKLEKAINILEAIPTSSTTRHPFTRAQLYPNAMTPHITRHTADEEVRKAAQLILEYIEDGYVTPEYMERNKENNPLGN